MIFSEKDPLLNFYANFVVHWVQICVLEPFQKSEVGDTDTRRLWHSLSRHIVSLEDKELTTDLAHDRQILLSQKYVMVIRVR